MKKIQWSFFLLLLFIFSYSREIIFISINSILAGNLSFYAKSTEIPWLVNQSPTFLVRLKYILTLSFSLLFAATTITGLKLSFKNNLAYRFSIFSYVSLFTLTGLALVIALISSSFSEFYPIFRGIIEYLHTPIFYLFFSLVYFMKNTLDTSN